MNEIALSGSIAPPRRFDPRVDGLWDGYRYEIDPDFADVAALVAPHREDRQPETVNRSEPAQP